MVSCVLEHRSVYLCDVAMEAEGSRDEVGRGSDDAVVTRAGVVCEFDGIPSL